MPPFSKALLTIVAALLICWSIAGNSHHLAQATFNQQEYEKEIRSAQQFETLGYIGAAVGLLLIIVSIPLWIYLDRKKKACKQAGQQTPDPGRSSNSEPPQT